LSSPDAMREKPGVRSHSFLITITRAPVVIVGDVKGCYDRGSPRVRSLVLLRHRAKSIVEVVSIAHGRLPSSGEEPTVQDARRARRGDVWGTSGARTPALTPGPRMKPKRMMGLEPTTFCMASRRSSQLSYIRRSTRV